MSRGLGAFAPQLVEEATKPVKEFGQLVRERRQKWGLPVRHESRIVPFRTATMPTVGTDEVDLLDRDPAQEPADRTWHIAQAERRLLEIVDRLDQEVLSPSEQRTLKQAADYETTVLARLIQTYGQSGG
jgi:hypothetical protein